MAPSQATPDCLFPYFSVTNHTQPPYKATRGPWTALSALIKVEETGQNEQSFLHAKSIQNLYNFLPNTKECGQSC